MKKTFSRIHYARILFTTLLYLLSIQFSFGQAANCPNKAPALGVSTGGLEIVCDLPGTIDFYLSGYEASENREVIYYINFGDNSHIEGGINVGSEFFEFHKSFTNEDLKKVNGKITHEYTETYCGTGKTMWEIQVRAVSSCNTKLYRIGSTSMFLQESGTADFDYSLICDKKVHLVNKSLNFINLNCESTELYMWDFGDGTTRNQMNEAIPVNKEIEHEYKCAGDYDIKLYAYSGYDEININGIYVPVGSKCGADSITKPVRILPKPKLKAIPNKSVCKGETIAAISLQNLDECTYDWYDKTSKQCKKTDVCALLNKKVAHKFTYTVSGDDIGLPQGTKTVEGPNAKIPSFVAENESNVTMTAKVCIVPINEDGCPGDEVCYEIKVSPGAKIENLKNYAFCRDTNAKIDAFKTNVSDATITWEVKSGDWQKIGFPAASGSGNIPAFQAKNDTKAPIKITVEVLANSSLCSGTGSKFDITVYPLPQFDVDFKSPTTCNGTDGWIEFQNLDLQVTSYNVNYKFNGEEKSTTLSVAGGKVRIGNLSKGKYSDIKIAAQGSECFVSTNDIILVDPSAPSTPVISAASPVCIGATLELKVDNADADIQSWKWEGPACDNVSWSSSVKEPTRGPMKYCMAGEYKLTVERNKCTASATVNVDYKEDPTVNLAALPNLCLDKDFTEIGNYVTYDWHGVTGKTPKWTADPADGLEFSNPNSETPVIKCKKTGKYKIKVEMPEASCGTKSSAEADVVVFNSSFTPDFTIDEVICVGDKITVTNKTSTDQQINYSWSVTPSTEVLISNPEDAAPSITFKEHGEYVVKVVMEGICSQETRSFNVLVKKDPTISINTIDTLCTNVDFVLDNSLVKYEWFSVKPNEQKVTWSIVDGDAAAVSISDVNALYPTIKVSESGDYTIKAIVNGQNCPNAEIVATAKFNVINADYQLDISNQDVEICYNNSVQITNNTDDKQAIKYLWEVVSATGEEVTGYTFENSTNTDKAPKIKFTDPGDYKVKVQSRNICNVREYDFNVKVKKDPYITISDLGSICNNTDLILDNKYVELDWYNMPEADRKIEWSVSPEAGVTITNATSDVPTFSFSETGDYTITAKLQGVNCDKSEVVVSAAVTVISDNLELKVELDKVNGCVPLNLNFTNTTSDEDEVTYNWIVDQPQENWEFASGNQTSKQVSLNILKSGKYNVKVEAKNKCNTKFLDYNIDAYDKVTLKLDEIPVVCGDYLFDATSEEQGLHITGMEEHILSSLWKVYKSSDNGATYVECAAEEYEFTKGDKNTLYPSIQIKQWGKYKIELQVESQCNNETLSTKVDIEEPIVINLPTVEPLCANIADEYGENPYTLTSDPTDGTWSWALDMPADQQEYLDAAKNMFYPNAPGTYKLKYSVTRKACTASKELEIVVKDYPLIELGPDVYVCEKDQTPVLLEGTPADGVWTGNEVSKDGDSYYFNPPLAVGDYDITYTITDAAGCKNRDTKKGYIQSLPDPNFGPDAHCLPDAVTFQPVVDVTTHTFKINYGDGKEGNDLTHLYEEIGEYDVKLIVTAPSGCVDSLSKKLLVDKYPDQKLIVSEHMACSPFTPEIKIEYDYSDPNTEFTWDFGLFGKQTTMQPTPVTFTAAGRDTTYQFSITIKNHCGEYTVTDTVRVLATPAAKIVPSIERGCSPVLVDFKNATLGSIQGMKYTWDFGDGSPREYEFRATHSFETGYKNDSTFSVMLIAENFCGADTTYQDIYVIPPVVFPQIVNPTPKVCLGDTVCILNETMEVIPHDEIITYKWDFGNGIMSDNPNDFCAVYDEPGNYKIELNITTSCGSSESDFAYVEVMKSPEFEIAGPDYICNLDTVVPTIALFSNIREVNWDFGNGDIINKFNPKYQYKVAGEYTITATVTEDNFASCKASKSMPLIVRELPDPEIEPLDVDTCSPFVYAPVISDELYYAIDYEDTGIMDSNKEHKYVNIGLEPIIYQTTIYLEDKYGCKSQKNGVINLYPGPVAGIAITNVVDERPEVVTFSSTSIGADACKWILPYAGVQTTCQDVEEYFYENKTEIMYLEVSNMYNCTDRDSIEYTPMMKGLYFPNTFSPNGVLEEVRTFNGVGLGLASYQLEIFDLYGNLIFKTTSLDANGTPNEGWDGRDKHGNLLPQDVYSWRAEAVFLDGSHYPFGNDVINVEGNEVNDVTVHRGSVLLLHR